VSVKKESEIRELTLSGVYAHNRILSVMAILRQSTLPVLQLGQTVGDGVVSNTTLREPTTLFDFKVQGLGLV